MKNSIVVWGVGAALLLAAVIGLGLLTLKEQCRDFDAAILVVDGKEFHVAVADTPTSRKRGLIGCAEIPRKSGMYFPYEQPESVEFWMKGMSMPLDIIWVVNGRVVGIEPNVPPQDELTVDVPLYSPPQPVTGVFEVPGGEAGSYGIKEGTIVQFRPEP